MQRIACLTVVLALCASACGGGGGSSTPTAPTPTTATLTGNVSDSLTGAALAGAAASINDGPNAGRSATSDASGAFQLTGLAVGGFTITVRRDGYDNLSMGVNLSADMTLPVKMAKSRLELSGGWTGTYTQSVNGNQSTRAATATLSQVGTAVTGTFQAGTLQGTFDAALTTEFQDARLSGTLRISSPSSTGAVICLGSGTFTGSPFPAFSMTAPLIVLTNCTGTVTNVTLALTR